MTDKDKDMQSDLMIYWLCDTVGYSWQIEKLLSWLWGLETDSQRVTWTAFAILAMFQFENINSFLKFEQL